MRDRLRPVESILTKEQINSLVQKTHSHNGYVSYKSNTNGSESPYELNITFFDAINNPNDLETPIETQVRRFLSQSIAMTLTGMPFISMHYLVFETQKDGTNLNETSTEAKLIIIKLTKH